MTALEAARKPMVRALALAALIVGLVVMHHLAGAIHAADAPHGADAAVPVATAEHGMVAPHGQPHGAVGVADPHESDSDHGSAAHVLHLCLAVLTAVVLLVATAARRHARRPRTAGHADTIRRPSWSPPAQPFGAALLTRLCVLRT